MNMILVSRAFPRLILVFAVLFCIYTGAGFYFCGVYGTIRAPSTYVITYTRFSRARI